MSVSVSPLWEDVEEEIKWDKKEWDKKEITGRIEDAWIDSILMHDFAECIPVMAIATAAMTLCVTFALFFATGKTTQGVCDDTGMSYCDGIEEWQIIPTISLTFVPWPGYIASLIGMLTSCALFYISFEMEHRMLRIQTVKMEVPPRHFITGWCCCCFRLQWLVTAAHVVGILVTLCLATCICCQLRLSTRVHSIAAFFMFLGGILMLLVQQQVQVTILELAQNGQCESTIAWSEEAFRAMKCKRKALAGYLMCFAGYSVAIGVRRHAVEPYSAALEYAVVVTLALGIGTYASDIRIHKMHFGDAKTRIIVIDEKEQPLM
mmetsp:Transcript_22254/g.31088  ORF Transcript_22254/g.31088 Transcript_22254/m.31088 type:complete len:320 (-) Transcript_22254:66-1025(-)|eukprot:CAMPEP_0184481528 /NCGR_PEP_ID=MMETSP0113_2-20130426/3077_1 /TAXON_ID=91329 /ORGANISM="Norrisiella sphaerica, Strain BC52" /LENGTH=319 /DNA_ID=CAMNT_0026860699 /DNA_START=146 /DNA_END=1105 /DNA_ORIENTATION=-